MVAAMVFWDVLSRGRDQCHGWLKRKGRRRGSPEVYPELRDLVRQGTDQGSPSTSQRVYVDPIVPPRCIVSEHKLALTCPHPSLYKKHSLSSRNLLSFEVLLSLLHVVLTTTWIEGKTKQLTNRDVWKSGLFFHSLLLSFESLIWFVKTFYFLIF